MAHNAADEAQVKASKQRNKNQRNQELNDIKILLEQPAGLRFLRRLMAEGKVFCTTFTGNSQSYFLEGHRNLALKFFHDVVEAAPGKVVELMLTEDQKVRGKGGN